MTTTSTTTIDYAGAMKTLRQRTSTLVPPPRTSSTRAAFDDILEIMDEIQEAMDTAEETESGLRSLGEMKANEMRKRDGRATTTTTTNDGDDAGGAVTTIGFGITGATGNDALVGGSTTVLFADATAATTTARPPTMMIVKKKKKPMQQQQQRPSSGEEPSKRLKTN